MSTIYSSALYMKGISVQGNLDMMNGTIHNIDRLLIGDWTFEVGDKGDLLIKNDEVVRVKISNNVNFTSNLKYERLFMVQAVNVEECIGLMVSASDKIYNMDMSQSPSLAQSLPTIKLSNEQKDPCFVGIITGWEDYTRNLSLGNIESEHEQEDNVNRVYVSTFGIGSVWVTDINGPIKKGDYLTTSSIPGYAMRQEEKIKYNYTGPRSMMNCNFHPSTIVLERPVDFDQDGPIFDPIVNTNGDPITDLEYSIKYINILGEQSNVNEFTKEIERLSSDGKKDMSKVMKSSKRTIFKACLISYCF